MKSINQARSILEKLISMVKTGDAQVEYSYGDTTSMRFGDNAITQNSIGESGEVSIEIAIDGRRGCASTNRFDDESLRMIVDRALTIAKQSPPDPEYMPPVEPCEYPEMPQRYFDETTKLSPDEIAEHISIVTEMAASKGYRAGGLYQSGATLNAIANNRGLFAFDRFTHVEYSCSVAGPTGSGYNSASSESIDRIDPEALARRAFGSAVAAQDPVDIEPGEFTVVLMPQAVIDLLEYFTYYMSRRDADEGTTAFAGKLGKKIFSDMVNIHVGAPDQEMPPPQFGNDGLPTRHTHWVRDGVLERLPMSRYWAKKMGDSPDAIEWPFSMTGQNKSIDELVSECGRGLLVRRFWYIEEVDAREMLLTGMTRDGLFKIENGEVTHPVKNLRFNESPMVVLANIVASGSPKRLSTYFNEPPYFAKVPAILATDFTFDSKTESM